MSPDFCDIRDDHITPFGDSKAVTTQQGMPIVYVPFESPSVVLANYHRDNDRGPLLHNQKMLSNNIGVIRNIHMSYIRFPKKHSLL
uniref:Uncharacterized protein n=1 Tax=Caenorhabditis japonica TaxID=281687 RepID=A0A8R1I9I6_CAEJA